MDQKLPYYMAYPMTLDFEDERAERMDYEYLRSMYPEIPKTILPYVEEECDRMAYENSMIYDQYPDKLQLRLMCGRICADIKKHEKLSRNESMRELLNDMEQGGKWLRDLTEVMLYQELFRRRSGQRRSARRFY
ncbi:MAG TPA: hypothetical protein H9748_08045 [Candidatus Mediterraneibacter norwichensis]|nr:hypothetical protein [Candidatus Mediterraneibacter norwichensis]